MSAHGLVYKVQHPVSKRFWDGRAWTRSGKIWQLLSAAERARETAASRYGGEHARVVEYRLSGGVPLGALCERLGEEDEP